jgi:hypothetical protein
MSFQSLPECCGSHIGAESLTGYSSLRLRS